jgi:hypothetical protein
MEIKAALFEQTETGATAQKPSVPHLFHFSDRTESAKLDSPEITSKAEVGPSEEQIQLQYRAHRNVQVFSWNRAMLADGGHDNGRDTDAASRILRTHKRLQLSGTARPLHGPLRGWERLIDELTRDFPNFEDLIHTVIRPHLTLVSRGYLHRMSNVVLVGPPGIGKTYFAQRLAEIVNTGPALFVPMASETNNSTLVGSSSFWSNAAPGCLFERLAWGSGNYKAVANPLVILDEIDKVKCDRYDPLGPLYCLLEVETARTFQDQSLPDVVIDASHVRVIATANDVSEIPEPLVSRVMLFHIEPPNRTQLQTVIHRIFEEIVARIGVRMSAVLPLSVLESAIALSPREVKVRLECAIALAVSRDRDHIDAKDWFSGGLGISRQKKIGFTA